jgi:hypothetical protein
MKVMSYETMANCTDNCLSWVKGDTSVSSIQFQVQDSDLELDISRV